MIVRSESNCAYLYHRNNTIQPSKLPKVKLRKTYLKHLLPILLCCASGCDANRIAVDTEILVIGGGTSGTIAAIQAAKANCKTILIESGSQLGGTITTGGVSIPGLFHAWGQQIIGGIGWELVKQTVRMNADSLPDFSIPYGHAHWKHQIPINGYLYALLSEEMCLNAGVALHYYETPTEIAHTKKGWIVKTAGKGSTRIYHAKQLIDCTGDAAAVDLAGFDRIKEEETQPGSLIFELEGYDYSGLEKEAIRQSFDEAIQTGRLLETDAYNGLEALLNARKGLAAQHVPGADSSTAQTHSAANMEGRKSLLRIVRFVRSLPGCENTRIKYMAPETAVRETYRINGLYCITLDDYLSGRKFDDALAYSFYPIDLHVSHGVEPRHLKDSVVATIPLRALIPKGSKNLIVAGRCISSDRLANSALRVQASCMAMGQAAGAVAAIACKENTTPSNVDLDKVKQLLSIHGAIVPN